MKLQVGGRCRESDPGLETDGAIDHAQVGGPVFQRSAFVGMVECLGAVAGNLQSIVVTSLLLELVDPLGGSRHPERLR